MASRPVHVQPLLRFGQNTSWKEKQTKHYQEPRQLSGLDPAYRTIGYGYTYRTYVLQVSQGIALYPPPPQKLSYRNRGEGSGRGYRSSSRAIRGFR